MVPPAAGLSVGPLITNAHSFRDLGGPFWFGGVSAGEEYVANLEGGYGHDSHNRPVWYGYGGIGVGVGGGSPVSASGGRSYTWTYGWDWGHD